MISTSLPGGSWLAAVADGMGGLPAGESASRTALDVLRQRLEGGGTLVEAVQDANRAVLERGRDRPMGTTLVAALVTEGRARIANVGDSRAYLMGPVGLVQVTADHTFAAEAARHGEATAREVASSRWGATLTRSLGAGPTVEVDEFGPLVLDPGVRILLCSDGVHRVLDDSEIEACLERRSPSAAVDRLVALGLERGGRDNLSAVILQWIGEGAARGRRRTVPPDHGVGDAAERPADAGRRPREARGADPRLDDARESPRDDPGFVLPEERPGRYGGGAEPWDPARLARRARREFRRKPGRLRSVLLVLALAGIALLMLALLAGAAPTLRGG